MRLLFDAGKTTTRAGPKTKREMYEKWLLEQRLKNFERQSSQEDLQKELAAIEKVLLYLAKGCDCPLKAGPRNRHSICHGFEAQILLIVF